MPSRADPGPAHGVGLLWDHGGAAGGGGESKPEGGPTRVLVPNKKRGRECGARDVVWPVLRKDGVGVKPLPRGAMGINNKAYP